MGRQRAVPPYVRDLIHRTEMQQHAVAHKALRQRDGTLIPKILVRLELALHAGEDGLR